MLVEVGSSGGFSSVRVFSGCVVFSSTTILMDLHTDYGQCIHSSGVD